MPEARPQEKKLQRTGGGTPYVYLPKAWAEDLFPGDRAVLRKLPIGVLVTPVTTSAVSAEYRVDSDSQAEVREAILSAYTQGHREIKLEYPKLDAEASPYISRFTSRLSGVVSEASNGKSRIREYTELENVDFALLLEGLFSKCEEIAAASRNVLRSGDLPEDERKERLEALSSIEDEADFLSFGLFRLLSSRSRYAEAPGEELVHLLFYAIINYAAERYCDSLQGMADAYANILSGKPRESDIVAGRLGELASIPERSAEFLEKARQVVLSRDGRHGFALRQRISRERREEWEALVAETLHSMSSLTGLTFSSLYPATQVGSRLLESGTYLESFFSRTSQFYFAESLVKEDL